MATPAGNNQTILQQLGGIGALEGKDLALRSTIDSTTGTVVDTVEFKDHSAVKSFFSNLFTSKATKLDRISRTARILETAITTDVRSRYSAAGSQDNFDIQIALMNVNTAMSQLKEQAQKLSSTQSSGSVAFGASGVVAANADPQVAATLRDIDTAAGDAIKQINRLKPRPLSDRAISMFSSNPKDRQILQLRKDLEKVNYDLTIIPSNHADYPLVKKEQAGLEYALQQLEMHVPTYKQDMRNIMADMGLSQVNIQQFIAVPDFDPGGPGAAPPVGKDSIIATLKATHATNPTMLAKIEDLELMFEASLLVKAPIDYQARRATARITAAHGGAPRGSIARFGVDFERNVYGEYAKGLIRGGLTYMAFNGIEGPMGLLGAVGTTASQYVPGYLAPVIGVAAAVLPYAAPVIAAKPDLAGKFVPQGVKNYFRGGYVEWLLS